MEKPQNLIDAENSLRIARLQYHVAKSNRAMRAAREDVDFWSDKAEMLKIMFEKNMISKPQSH
jgi:hypothetical protein